MAKKDTMTDAKAAVVAVDARVMWNLGDVAVATLSAHGHTMDVATVPTATILYLLANGFSQSLTDAGTTASARAKDAAIKAANEERGKGNEMNAEQTRQFVAKDDIRAIMEAAAIDARNKRVEALLAGEMVYGARGPNGPRKSPLEAFVWDAAEADARAYAKAQGKTWPKDKDAAERIINLFIEKRRGEYEKRFAQTSDINIDF